MKPRKRVQKGNAKKALHSPNKIEWSRCSFCGRKMNPTKYAPGSKRFCDKCADERHKLVRERFARDYETVTIGDYVMPKKRNPLH